MTDQPSATDAAASVDAPETAAANTATAPLNHTDDAEDDEEDHEQKQQTESNSQADFDYATIKRKWEVCMYMLYVRISVVSTAIDNT